VAEYSNVRVCWGGIEDALQAQITREFSYWSPRRRRRLCRRWLRRPWMRMGWPLHSSGVKDVSVVLRYKGEDLSWQVSGSGVHVRTIIFTRKPPTMMKSSSTAWHVDVEQTFQYWDCISIFAPHIEAGLIDLNSDHWRSQCSPLSDPCCT
jgi:hypothetical protein